MRYTLKDLELEIFLGLERGDNVYGLQHVVQEIYSILNERAKSIPVSPPPLGVSVLHLLRTEE